MRLWLILILTFLDMNIFFANFFNLNNENIDSAVGWCLKLFTRLFVNFGISLAIYYFIVKTINSIEVKEIKKFALSSKLIFSLGLIMNSILILKMGGLFDGNDSLTNEQLICKNFIW